VQSIRRFLLIAVLSALVIACSGGGGGGGSTSSTNPASPALTFTAASGVAQKGPLQSGSTVSAQELDSRLSPTGKQYTYQITSNLGTFAPMSTFGSQYIGLNATGYYFDEVTNTVSSGPVTLSGYSDLSSDAVLNVNLLTALAYQRIQYLVTTSQMTFAAAKSQAETEVLKAFHIPNPATYGSFGTLDISKSADGDHILAAISSIFDYGNSAGTLSALIANVEADIKTNGAITNASTQAVLAASAKALNPAAIAANLTNAYSPVGVTFTASDISDWIDQDGDGLVGGVKFQIPDATPTSTFTFPAFVTQSSVGTAISVSAGQLSVNGAVVTGSVTLGSGDTVSVAPGPAPFPNGVFTIYLLSNGTRIGRASFVSGLVSIAVTPATPSLPIGLTQQFVATGTFTDTSTATLTANVSWATTAPFVAAVNSTSGMATALALGAATVTATSGSLAGSTTVTVVPAVLESITLSPNPLLTGVGIVRPLSAQGLYSDGTSATLTSTATWSSASTSVATVSGGMVTGVSFASTTVTASSAGVSGSVPVNVVTNTWAAASSLPTALVCHTATLLQNNTVLVAGGHLPNGTAVASAETYDSSHDAWSSMASMPAARFCHTATLLGDGRMLVAGGYDASDNVTATASVYDPTANAWTAVPNMSTPRVGHTATLLSNGQVLISGGLNAQSAQIFDPVSDTWSAPVSMLALRSGHTATLLSNGKVLVAGGSNGGGVLTATTEVYDPTSSSWSAGPSMSVVRSGHTATLLQSGLVLVAGSGGYGSVQPASTAETYDPGANSWTSVGSMATGRGDQTATLLPSGKVLVAGGYGPPYLNSAELFDPTTSTWSPAASMASAHAGHTATLLPVGMVLVTGGQDSTGNPASICELYW
jgi:N-acetylneuraminic acid mutarotase